VQNPGKSFSTGARKCKGPGQERAWLVLEAAEGREDTGDKAEMLEWS
jgi:hypothetical protein